MPLNRPTLAEIYSRVLGDFDGRVGDIDPRLHASLVNILLTAHSGAANELHGQISYAADEAFPQSCSEEILRRFRSTYNVTPIEADAATGNVTATGDNGVEIPSGTEFVRGDGVEYLSTGSVIVAGGTATVPVEAVVAAAAGNADTGTLVAFSQPIAGIDPTATVASPGLTGGRDAESKDSLKARILDRLARPPRGGAINDWEFWAFEVPDTTRVWVFSPEDLSAEVFIYFVLDGQSPITPDAGQLTTMQTYLDGKRPVGSRPQALAPTLVSLDLDVVIVPDTAEIRAAVTAEFADMLLRDAAPDGTIYVSRIREALSLATGEDNHILNSPTVDQVADYDELHVPGTITFS